MRGDGEGIGRDPEAKGKGWCSSLPPTMAGHMLTGMQEMAKGGKVQALTDAVNSLERELVKTKTQLEIKEGSSSEDKKRVDAAKKAVKDVSHLIPPIDK